MLWICRECGVEAQCDDDVGVAWLGWSGLDGDTGVCATCSGGSGQAGSIRLRQAAQRRGRSERALAVTRALIARARQRAWDESVLEDAAERLGFSPRVCGECRGARSTTRCPTCEGAGILWGRAATLLCGSALLRLAMWPRNGAARNPR